MNRRFAIFGGVAVLTVAVAVLGAATWYVLFRDDAPPPVDLASAVQAAASVIASQPTAMGTATPAIASASLSTTPSAQLAGRWSIVQAASFVGYRVQEQLANIGGATAVGRTSALDGSLVFDGASITEVSVTADVTQLKSDATMRDRALSMQALETSKYGAATFKLTQPIKLDTVPVEGQSVQVTAVGDLTLHGVTRSVSIPVQGQLVNGQVVVVGSLGITFADYGIAQPKAASVLSVDDHGTLELQLVFARA